MKKIVAVLMMIVCLTGCNTMQGVGKDLQKGGQAIERAAQ